MPFHSITALHLSMPPFYRWCCFGLALLFYFFLLLPLHLVSVGSARSEGHCALLVCVHTRVLHGPPGPGRAGPARSPSAVLGWAFNDILWAGCGPETCRPGLVNNNFAGSGPGQGLSFPGLGLQ